MPWMREWPGGFPLFAAEAQGARFPDVDGHEYVDFCLGDTGAMTGHSPAPTVARGRRRRRRAGSRRCCRPRTRSGSATELTRRFGLPYWQFALTATDANRFAIRARARSHRPAEGARLQLVLPRLRRRDLRDARRRTAAPLARPGNVGPPVDPARHDRVVEFNDLDALERGSPHGDVACVLAEPALTNIGIVLPEPGFHDALRELTREHRHAARDRRDAHDLRRAGRLHRGLRPRARPPHDRQADRRAASPRRPTGSRRGVAERIEALR